MSWKQYKCIPKCHMQYSKAPKNPRCAVTKGWNRAIEVHHTQIITNQSPYWCDRKMFKQTIDVISRFLYCIPVHSMIKTTPRVVLSPSEGKGGVGYSYPNCWTQKPVAVSQSSLYRNTVSMDQVQKDEIFRLILGWSVSNTDLNSPQKYTGHGWNSETGILCFLIHQSIEVVTCTDPHLQSS